VSVASSCTQCAKNRWVDVVKVSAGRHRSLPPCSSGSISETSLIVHRNPHSHHSYPRLHRATLQVPLVARDVLQRFTSRTDVLPRRRFAPSIDSHGKSVPDALASARRSPFQWSVTFRTRMITLCVNNILADVTPCTPSKNRSDLFDEGMQTTEHKFV
jgi:hypothetical protein